MGHKTRGFLVLVVLMLVLVTPAYGESHADGESEGHQSGPWYRNMDLWKLINLSVLIFVLYKFLAVPIARMLSERTHSIEEMINTAQKQQENARNELQEMRERLANAKGEIDEMINRGQDEARRIIEDLKKNTSVEVEHIQQRAADDLTHEFTMARQELVEFIAAKAVERAEQKIKKMDINVLHSDYIKRFQVLLNKQGGNGEGP